MMRAWENRSDTQVIDEPFYAHFLQHTQIDHPMAEAIIAHGETNWREVVKHLSEPPANGIFYQKHITTHWLEHYSTNWLDELSHVFLIRSPAAVVASYANKRESLSAYDLGYQQQAHLFDVISQRTGKAPLVIDSYRFLNNPESQLRCLCDSLRIKFQPQMLTWPAGARPSDGLWGEHWYDSVNASTGFSQPTNHVPVLDDQQQIIAESCQAYYDELFKFAL
jgi:hypothetical protein